MRKLKKFIVFVTTKVFSLCRVVCSSAQCTCVCLSCVVDCGVVGRCNVPCRLIPDNAVCQTLSSQRRTKLRSFNALIIFPWNVKRSNSARVHLGVSVRFAYWAYIVFFYAEWKGNKTNKSAFYICMWIVDVWRYFCISSIRNVAV